MSHPNKAKGSRFEAALREWFRAVGIAAYRPAQEGHHDVGDLHGLSPFIGQAKDWENVTAALRVGVDGAQTQARHAGEPFGVAFIKRRRAGIGACYAVLTVSTFAQVLLRLRAAEAHLARLDPDAYTEHVNRLYGGIED